ncbi:class I SAM-dependent methyltransferase [Streptomyces sp. NPDC058653]|uniref:class I SAM-dependent methyltransferase n=1 Tax=Streptomyces sp. NPDC058653 TaxID=3346576 RepID=UPI00366896AE
MHGVASCQRHVRAPGRHLRGARTVPRLAHNGPVTDRAPVPLSLLLSEEGQALLAELRDHDPAQELALATRLRRDHPAELVSSALAQARLRQRAVAKFGGRDAYRMYFTPDGVEQATRTSVAAHRAARFRDIGSAGAGRAGAGPARITDLCCGIGGDAIELARAGFAVTAVDRAPGTCEMAAHNIRTLAPDAPPPTVVCADVMTYDLTAPPAPDALFVDPARRGGRGRIFDPEAYSPPLSWAVDAVRTVGAGGIKIAPGIPHELVPDDFEAEWISDGGDVKEAVLWYDASAPEPGPGRPGGVTPGARRATLLPAGITLTGRGLPDPQVRPVGRYLYEPDGAVIRAHLVAEAADELDGGLIDETIAYITADERRSTPYATAYEITDVLPFNLKRLKALLRERDVGVLTVKKRGSPVEPEELRRKMRLKGRNSATVFLTRVAGAPAMLLGGPAAEI